MSESKEYIDSPEDSKEYIGSPEDSKEDRDRFEDTFEVNRKRIYCGNDPGLPAGYDKKGTPYECLKKGVGVGIFVIPLDKIIASRSKSKSRKPFPLNQKEIADWSQRLGINAKNKTGDELLNSIITKLKILEEYSSL